MREDDLRVRQLGGMTLLAHPGFDATPAEVLVRLSGESSNRLFEILADWNDILRSTSLNDNRMAEPVKEPAGKAKTRR